ncbi:hypothetical protein ABZX74_46375 [Streptomyces olivaceoviridis]|uniref:hypothetical protein n=1 Tax=Streptomyces olivaceoviridis TaxID=1921 RepID=UPI0033AB4E1C
MDAHTGDVSRIDETLLDVGRSEYAPAFEEALAYPVGDLLVMDRVILVPEWRGQAWARCWQVRPAAACRRTAPR